MSDEELKTYAKKIVEENKIKSRYSLEKIDRGLYEILRKRNLLDAVVSRELRSWSSMTDEELVSHAKTFIEENEIKNRSGLQKADPGLYLVLRKRNLLNAVIPKKQKQRPRDFFPKMSDKELISYVEKFIEKNQINSRSGLAKADPSLYQILRKRNLLNIIFLDSRNVRSYGFFTKMSDKELLFYAKKFIEENEIKNRSGLQKADSSLYTILRVRNLLSAVFSDVEQAKKTAAVKQVVDAMKEFGGSK